MVSPETAFTFTTLQWSVLRLPSVELHCQAPLKHQRVPLEFHQSHPFLNKKVLPLLGQFLGGLLMHLLSQSEVILRD